MARARLGFLYGEAGAGRRAHAGELAGAVVSEQEIQLFIARAVSKTLDVVDHVAIGDREVEIAIVVIVEERRAKSDIAAASLLQHRSGT